LIFADWVVVCRGTRSRAVFSARLAYKAGHEVMQLTTSKPKVEKERCQQFTWTFTGVRLLIPIASQSECFVTF
jgi:hypothetical protein